MIKYEWAPTTSEIIEASKPHQERLAKYRKWLRDFEGNKRDELDEQQIHRKYYHGKHWTADELRWLRKRRQKPVFDNRIGRKIDFIVGVEQRMRRDPKGHPNSPKEEPHAFVTTAALRTVCQQNGWEDQASESMLNGMRTGVGAAFIGAKTFSNGKQDVGTLIVDEDRFFYDPRSTKADFSDARFMGVHLWVDLEEAIEIAPMFANYFEDAIADAQRGHTSLKTEEDRSEQWADFENRRVRIIEIYEKGFNPETMRSEWFFCKFTGDVAIDARPSPYLDQWGVPENPYEAWTAYIDEKGIRYSPIRNMKPMQDEVNQRRSRFLHLNNSTKMFVRDKGSQEDEDEMLSKMGRAEAVVYTNGQEWGKDIGVIDNTKEMNGQFQLLTQAEMALENIGPNPGLAGKGQGVEGASGRALMAQRDSGMTELSPVFNNHRSWKLRCYKKMWNRVKQMWDAERHLAVSDDPALLQFIPINSIDPQTGMPVNNIAEIDTDVILDEGPDTVVMQEELMQVLTQVASAPPALWKVFIELSGVTMKDRLQKMVDEANAPSPEMVEFQKRLQKLEELLQAAKIDVEVARRDNLEADSAKKLADSGLPPDALAAFPVESGAPSLVSQIIASDAGIGQPQAPPQQPQGIPGQNAMMPQEEGGEGEMPGGLPVVEYAF